MAKKNKDDLINITHEPHTLPCKLTTEDRAAAAGQLAETIQNLESLEVEHKVETKEFNSRKQQFTGSIHRLSREVRNGEAARSVDCELRLNYTTLMASLWRTDTDEFVEERPMTEDEKQMPLDFESKKSKQSKKAGKDMKQTVTETEEK